MMPFKFRRWDCGFLFLLLVFMVRHVQGRDGDVQLAKGKVSGVMMRSEAKSEDFYGYIGIPYAQPPVKDRRFQKPHEHPGWDGQPNIRVGKQVPPPCPQLNEEGKIIGDEDCLYLNVFTSILDLRRHPPGALYPVMVYIHGGGYYQGAASTYGPQGFMDDHKVLVVIQYRLGALGFMSTDDSVAAGNYGLLDVVMALQWVHENIIKFGGDNEKITVFGNSAGAAIVELLMISPLAKGLFSSAIAQSGSALCYWALEENRIREFADELGNKLNCPTNTSQDLVDCLRTKNAHELVYQQHQIFKQSLFPWGARPIIDKDLRSQPFLPAHPRELFEADNVNLVPLMAGTTTDEGLIIVQMLLMKQHTLLRNTSYIEHDLLPQIFTEYYGDQFDSATLWNGAKNVYFRDVSFDDQEAVIPPLIEMLSDVFFHHCLDETLRVHSSKSPGKTFAYVFGMRHYATYEDPKNQKLKDLSMRSSIFNRAVNHADELPYLFTINQTDRWAPNLKHNNAPHRMAHLWTNFATYWNPTPPTITSNSVYAAWPSYSEQNQTFYHLQQTFALWPGGFRHRELATWRHLLMEAEEVATEARLASHLKDPIVVYRTVMWALVAAIGFLVFIVLVLSTVIACTGKKESYSTT